MKIYLFILFHLFIEYCQPESQALGRVGLHVYIYKDAIVSWVHINTIEQNNTTHIDYICQRIKENKR